MLSEMSSWDVTEWRAYETYHGPLDRTWDQEMQAQTHELLQTLINITVQANSEKKQNLKVETVGRPWQRAEDMKEPEKQETPEEKQAREIEEQKTKNRFYSSLSQRNAQRGYTAEYIERRKRARGLI